jgi:hypothetical protein
VVPLLVVRRRGELRDADVPRVERRDEALDGAALARGVPALEDDAQRRADAMLADLAAQQQAQPQQVHRGALQAFLGLLLRQRHGQIDIARAGHGVTFARHGNAVRAHDLFGSTATRDVVDHGE